MDSFSAMKDSVLDSPDDLQIHRIVLLSVTSWLSVLRRHHLANRSSLTVWCVQIEKPRAGTRWPPYVNSVVSHSVRIRLWSGTTPCSTTKSYARRTITNLREIECTIFLCLCKKTVISVHCSSQLVAADYPVLWQCYLDTSCQQNHRKLLSAYIFFLHYAWDKQK